MNLQLDVLDAIEAPLSAMEGVGLCLMGLGAGILVGVCIAT